MNDKANLQRNQRSRSEYTETNNLSKNPNIKIQQVDIQQNLFDRKVFNGKYQIQKMYDQKQNTYFPKKYNQKEQFHEQQKINIVKGDNTKNLYKVQQVGNQKPNDDYIEDEGTVLRTKRTISEFQKSQLKDYNIFEYFHNNNNNQVAKQHNSQSNSNQVPKIINQVAQKNNTKQSYYLPQNAVQYNNCQDVNQEQISQDTIQKQLSSYIQDSQLLQYQSEIKDQMNRCYNCNNTIQGTCIQLSCFHFYDIDCFKECIKNQISTYEQTKQISCYCNKKIKKLPFIEEALNKKWQDELIQKQQQLIYQEYNKRIRKCKSCHFFWMIDKYDLKKICQYCKK